MHGATLRALGLCGVAGAAAMLVGDLLMLGRPLSGAEFLALQLEVMAALPPERVLLGGLLGPVGACLLVPGAGFVYGLLLPGRLRSLATGGLGALGVIAGAYHAVFALLGLLATARPGLQAASQDHLWVLAQGYLGALSLVAAGPGLVGSLALAAAVLTGRSRLPRAAVLVTPLALLPALLAAGALLPAPVGGPLLGTAFNLSFLLSFGALLGLAGQRGLLVGHASVTGRGKGDPPG